VSLLAGSPAQAPPPAPTRTRWLILLLISLMYLITYVDRTGISVAAPEIGKEFGLSQTELGIMFSAFLWAYAIGQLPAGWCADRFGPRIVFLVIVPFWSLMTALTSVASGIASLVGIRFIFGLGEAGAFPTATRAMQLWFPKSERGTVHGVTHCFSRFGIAITPFVAISIMLALGWRSIFYISATAGLLWSLLFYLVYRNLPEEHPGVNRPELARIRGWELNDSIHPSASASKPVVPWREILRSDNMRYIAAGYCCFYYGTYFFVTWFPAYLLEYRHLSLSSVGKMASIPLLAGMLADLAGGSLTDTIYRRTGRLRFARRVVAAPAMLASGCFLIPAALVSNPWTAILCLTGSLFCLELVIGPAWAVSMDVGGEYSGTVSGVMNMAGSLAASLFPIIFGLLVQRGLWIAPFFVSAAVLLCGAAIWTFLIDPEKSVVKHLSAQRDLPGPGNVWTTEEL
jgi:sugar phosphate permease